MKYVCIFAVFFLTCSTFAQTTRPSTQPAQDQAALEKQLEDNLTNATLVGHFTVDGAPSGPLREDRYTLGPVKKLAGDNWLFSARIGNAQMMIPLVIPIQWAGDTPVISVTNFGVLGMRSKYTARIVLYADHYAGFWSAGPDHQGVMYGRIEHPPTTQPAEAR